MSEQNRDDFYEGPPVEDAERWHEGAIFEPEKAAQPSPGAAVQPTPDPSLSRAVDRADAGLAPDDAGYDRSNEGPAAGPLDPEYRPPRQP